MSELSLIDFLAYKRTQVPSRAHASDACARLALDMCEHKFLHKDWEGFGRWFQIFRESRYGSFSQAAITPLRTMPPAVTDIAPIHHSDRVRPDRR
jgi:hypothetical protein